MLTPTPLEEQLHAARSDQLRVLVVGAGVGGVTLAQLLRGRGLHPVLVERAGPDADEGYMLGLMPLVDGVLRRVGVQQDYLEASVGMHRYQLRSSRGRVIRTYSVEDLLGRYGHYRGIERGRLLDATAAHGAPTSFATTVTALEQAGEWVTATLSSGEVSDDATFDVVVAADGMHSTTRDLVLGREEVETLDTGWGGWVAWTETDPDRSGLYTETWGPGFFVGLYPVRDRVGVFVGGDRRDTEVGPGPFVAGVRDRLRQADAATLRALSAVEVAEAAYYWSLTDTRSARWAVDRVVLLGDAAAGLLPTAGVGAAMAMDSAAVLAERLAEAGADEVPEVLRTFERDQRPRVIAAHDNSRQLARLMFRHERVFAVLRDALMRFVTLRMALGPIAKLHEDAAGRDSP